MGWWPWSHHGVRRLSAIHTEHRAQGEWGGGKEATGRPMGPGTRWSFPAVPAQCGSCAGWVWSMAVLQQVRKKGGKGSRKEDSRGKGRSLGGQAVYKGWEGRGSRSSLNQAPGTDPGHVLAAPKESGHQGLQGGSTTCPQPLGPGV